MKHSNVFYILKNGQFEAVKDAVAVRNKAGLDLFRIGYKISEGQTGCSLASATTKSEMDGAIEAINADLKRTSEAIQNQLLKTGLSPRYTRPEERREDIFPTPAKEKAIVAACIGEFSSKRHKYRESYHSDSFSLYSRVADADTPGRNLYLLYDGWMLYMGSEYQQEEIIAQLSQGIPDFRQQMQDEVETCMADPKQWVNVSYAAFFDRLEEARAHNRPIWQQREAEDKARRAAAEQADAERQAALEEKYQAAIRSAERAIATHGAVVDDKDLHGTSLMLQLFRENGIQLPLRTQGWVKSALYAIEYRQGNWYCQIFKGHKASPAFWEQFNKLEEIVNHKFEQTGAFIPPQDEDAEDSWER